jgi:hypothetical protein
MPAAGRALQHPLNVEFRRFQGNVAHDYTEALLPGKHRLIERD